jgi:hypothetical protein
MGRYFWAGLWAGGGALLIVVAILAHGWASIFLVIAAGWLLYSAWQAYSAPTFVVRDALGREIHRSQRRS